MLFPNLKALYGMLGLYSSPYEASTFSLVFSAFFSYD